MRGFDLDGGTFFMCTEISPRCYTIQQVSDVDVALKEVTMRRCSQTSMSASLPSSAKPTSVARPPSSDVAAHSSYAPNSPLPMLPWWFTAECRQHLMGVPSPMTDERAVTPDTRPPSSIGAQPISQEQLRERVQRQLEYYFSRENLINDRYLRCQMDADQYVPIKIVANFPKVTQLTTDLGLIVDVLKSSSHVQVDETGQKVRPMSRRCTIILREIPGDADENEVKAMFGDNCPPYQTLSYGLNNSWYVTFATEQDTQKAFFHLQTLGKTFNGNPVFARIKTGGAPLGADLHAGNAHQTSTRANTPIPLMLNGGTLRGQLIVHQGQHAADQSELIRNTPSPSNSRGEDIGEKNELDLGKILAQCGYSPRATFRPLALSPAPLQPTAVPQLTSYFAQPILHNGDFAHCSVHHRSDFTLRASVASLNEMAKKEEADDAQTIPLEEGHLVLFDDRQQCCDDCCVEVNFDGIVSGCLGENAHVLWEEKEDSRAFRKRKRSRAHSEPSLAYCPTQFAVGRNEFILRQCAKEENRSLDPEKLAATMLPSPVPRITDVPRLNGKGAISAKEGSVDETGDKHCSTTTGGALAGFQRQESVEAYHIAVAANGVAKQRRMTLEIEEEEWEAVSNRKTRKKPTAEKYQNRQLHNTAASSPKHKLTAGRIATGEQQTDRQLSRLFGVRSVDSVQPRPLSDSANYHFCHKNGHPGPAKICRFSKSPNPVNDFGKIVWDNDSMGKLTMPPQQFVPKITNRVVQPLLSLASATFSPLNSSALQQLRRQTFLGTCSGGRGRRVAAEIGRKCGGGRGRTGSNEWGVAMPTASNTHCTTSFVGTNGSNAPQFEEGMAQKMEQGTMKRTKRPSERGEAETRPSRTNWKTTERKRSPPLHTQQNGTVLSQKQQFQRNSRETAEKDSRGQKSVPKKETVNCGALEGVQERQQKHNNGFNFEEREFPALLSCASASNEFGHAQQNAKLAADTSTNSIALPSVQDVPSALDCASIGATSTTIPSTVVQLQFSAVVAGHGRRRATIGTTSEGGRKGPRAAEEDSSGHEDEAQQQQRSGTIGASERSYAQMLKG